MASKPQTQLSNGNYLIVLVLLTLIAVGVTVLVGKSLVTGILRDTKVYQAKVKANDQLARNLEAAPLLLEQYQNLGAKKDLIADALPNTSDFPALMAMLESLGGSSGATMKSISPSLTSVATATTTPAAGAAADSTAKPSGAKVPQPQPYNVSLAFDSTYAGLRQLLGAMEQSARPLRVTSLQLSGSGGSMAIQMEATTYYQDKASLPISTETVK